MADVAEQTIGQPQNGEQEQPWSSMCAEHTLVIEDLIAERHSTHQAALPERRAHHR